MCTEGVVRRFGGTSLPLPPSKTASRSVRPFLQGSPVCPTHGKTDHGTCDVRSNRPHYARHAMRPETSLQNVDFHSELYCKRKMCHTPLGVGYGTSSFLDREPVGGQTTEVCDARSVRRQTYGYLPSRRASPPLGRHQIILLGDGGTRM